MMKAGEKAVFHARLQHNFPLLILFFYFRFPFLSLCLSTIALMGISTLSGSVLSGEGLHSLQKVQGQAVLGVVLREDFNQAADQPAGLRQGHQGAPQLTGILQHTTCHIHFTETV